MHDVMRISDYIVCDVEKDRPLVSKKKTAI